MVKLTGPMMSVTALGKCFKVIVYSVWKGIQYGRMLVTPHNPQSGGLRVEISNSTMFS